MRIHKDSQNFGRGFLRLWERIHEIFGRRFVRIHETLGEDL